MMDAQQFQLFFDRLARIDKKCDEIVETMKEHVEEDKLYWKKIDKVEGQVSLVKWIVSAVGLGGIASYLGIKH